MCPGVTQAACLGRPISVVPGTPWFDADQYLGKRGHKYCTEPTRYLLAAVKGALDDAQMSDGHHQPIQTGIVVGTNYATWEVTHHLDSALKTGGSAEVQPMEAPCFSINIPASEASKRYGFQAFCLTLTSPVVAGLQALVVAVQSLKMGRANMVVASATEHGIPTLHDQATGLNVNNPREGACAIVLEKTELPGKDGTYDSVVNDYYWATLNEDQSWDRLKSWLKARVDSHFTQSQEVLSLVTNLGVGDDYKVLADLLPSFERPNAVRWIDNQSEIQSSVTPLLQIAQLVAAGQSGVVIGYSQTRQLIAVSICSASRARN